MIEAQRVRKPWMILLLIVSLFSLTFSSIYTDVGMFDKNWRVAISISAIVWLLVYFLTTTFCFNSIYLFASAYIVPLTLFHLGITIPDALGVFEKFGWPDGNFAKWLSVSGYYTVVSLSAVGIGFAFSVLTSRVKKYTPLDSEEVDRVKLNVYRDGLMLLAASAIFLIMAIYTYGNILNYSRVDFFRGVGDTRGLGVFLMVFPGALTLLMVSANNKQRKLFAYAITGLGILLLLFSGYRAMAMFPLMVGIVLWVKTGSKIPTWMAVGLVFGTVVIIPALSELRSFYSYSEIDKTAIERSIENSETKETFRTIGQTGGVAAHVFKLVPDVDPYRYGTTYLDAVANAVPNILPKISSNRRFEAKKQAFSDRSAISEMIPSDWLTYRIARDKFDRGEGVGFSGLAEPYLNFGYAGVLVYFLLVGFLLAKMELKQMLYHPGLIVFAGAIFWTFSRSVRNDIATFIKPMVFILTILLIGRVIQKVVYGRSIFK